MWCECHSHNSHHNSHSFPRILLFNISLRFTLRFRRFTRIYLLSKKSVRSPLPFFIRALYPSLVRARPLPFLHARSIPISPSLPLSTPLSPSLSLSIPLSPSLSLSLLSLPLFLISPSLSISLLLPYFLSLSFSLSSLYHSLWRHHIILGDRILVIIPR
jgi:hypothetical protein